MKLKSLALLLIIPLLSLSCSGTKKVLDEEKNTSEETIPLETPTPPEPPQPPVIEQPEETIKEEPKIVEEEIVVELTKIVFDHSLWQNLLQKHVTNTGKVNYKGFKTDKQQLKTYLDLLANNTPKTTWSTNDQLAYWMNAYNAFTIKLIIDNYPVKSIKDIKDPWDKRFFKIGSKWRNLNEIEHKILRPMGDARIHFGINCASFSCPTLSNVAFTSENVDSQLELLAKSFINNKTHNDISTNSIKLSKIFQWFSKDFKTNGSLIDFLNKYSDIEINKKAKKSFKKYNWTLNE